MNVYQVYLDAFTQLESLNKVTTFEPTLKKVKVKASIQQKEM